MTPAYFFVLFLCTLLFGSVMGAYFATAEYRIRCGGPLVSNLCRCPDCGHILKLKDQIPVLSWLLLKGRCRYCGRPVSVRYPLIEGGFLLAYGFFFLLFLKNPAAMVCAWLGFLSLLLLVRCRGFWRGILKGFLIFAAYHLLYGAALFCIWAALGLI